MDNAFMIPFEQHSQEKTASAGPNTYAQIFVSGEPEAILSIMGDEDRAFHSLQDDVIEKLASGSPLSSGDIGQLTDTEIGALSLLGEDVMYKSAAYLEFYNQMAADERAGRNFARAVRGMQKEAAAAEAATVNKVASNPAFRQGVVEKLAAELARRGLIK